jgi:hypothetical protein
MPSVVSLPYLQKKLQLDPVLKELNSVHTLPSYSFKTNIIIQFKVQQVVSFLLLRLKFLHPFLISLMGDTRPPNFAFLDLTP